MLENWRIGNFKSVYEHTVLDLAPLTIFVGNNSSGKSTFIQSMLLVAQTIGNQVYSRPIILNGHIARLGNIDDLASKGSHEKEIRFGFKIKHSSDTWVPHRASLKSGELVVSPYWEHQDIAAVDCDFTVGPNDEPISKELQQLQPQLARCRIEVTSKEIPNDRVRVSIERSGKNTEERKREVNISQEYRDTDGLSTLKYRVLDPSTYPDDQPWMSYEIPKNSSVVGCRLSHFIPTSLSVTYDATYERARQFIQQISQIGSISAEHLQILENDPFFNNPTLLKRIFQYIRENQADLFGTEKKILATSSTPGSGPRSGIAKDGAISRQRALVREFDANPRLETLARILKNVPSRALALAIRHTVIEHMDELINIAKGEQPPNIMMRSLPLPGAARNAPYFLQLFFVELFKYLGPLRDEPKAFYPLEGAVNPRDVGLKGEYTAAVLDLHKNASIHYMPSSCFGNKGGKMYMEEATLQSAVIDWLRYMGVVRDVQTHDKGIFGHELKVATDSGDTGTLHNLTHVGVGVSQILPILVMSLLAEPESVLVFEQPEIHLHPKVQTLLADFLLSLALSKKQCIVETHSEYIINRLRYRAAIEQDRALLDLVSLYFVEKREGHSKYRSVKINEFGAIPDWPDGFFDESQKEIENILLAAMNKRKSNRK